MKRIFGNYQITTTAEAERSITSIASLVTTDRRLSERAGPASYRLFEMLPVMPRFNVDHVCRKLGTTFPTANAAVQTLDALGIVTEMTGQKSNRNYGYAA